MDRKYLVTVCDKCFTATCWQGIFMCQESDTAGTVDLPAWILDKLDFENRDYYKKT